jgi:hypothetical protein
MVHYMEVTVKTKEGAPAKRKVWNARVHPSRAAGLRAGGIGRNYITYTGHLERAVTIPHNQSWNS